MFSKTDIEKYFLAEKQAGLLFLILGIIAILLAISFYFFLKNNFYKGLAVPLIVIGILQAIVGFAIYSRSDQQRIDNVYAFDMNPSKLKNEELPRMKTVEKNFPIYKWIEILLFIAGIALIVFFRTDQEKQFWLGLGIALALESALMFSADFMAEKRARTYIVQLESYMKK